MYITGLCITSLLTLFNLWTFQFFENSFASKYNNFSYLSNSYLKNNHILFLLPGDCIIERETDGETDKDESGCVDN